jgi:hypothetical protein
MRERCAADRFSGDGDGARATTSIHRSRANTAKVNASATTGSSGTAVYKLRLSKSDPLGTYHADASAAAGGHTGAGGTTFVVQ